MHFTIGFIVCEAAGGVGGGGGISALYHVIFSLSSVSSQLICPHRHESSRVFCERDKRVCMIMGLTGVAISSVKYVGEFNLSDMEE